MIRSIKHLYQRLTRGFDDPDTWSLDVTMFEWLEPRLEVLIKHRERVFEFSERTDKMKKLLIMIQNKKHNDLNTEEMYVLFAECLPNMWW